MMNKPEQPMQLALQQPVQQQAAHFVTRLYSGELSAQEERQLQQWRYARPEHDEAFQAMLSLWELSNNLYQPVAQQRTLSRRLRSWGISAAAGVLLSAGVLYLASGWLPSAGPATPTLISQSSPQPTKHVSPPKSKTVEQIAAAVPAMVHQEHRYLQTGVGEVDTVALSDGSTVTLNTATSLQIAFNDEERYVVLVAGEAFFDVESDVNRAFVIDTGEQIIRVLGTKFNVRKEDSAVRVAVVEGKVAVSRMPALTVTGHVPSSEDIEFEAKDYLLEAGAVGSFSATADVVAGSNFAQVSEAQSWRRGIFRFDDSSLDAVVKEFNRYRSHKIRIVDETAANLRISGVFHFNDGDGLLQALTASLPIELEQAGPEVLIRKAP